MRGYQKRVVYLKNPGSAIFEEAYFIIKESHEADDEKTIIDEANRIIEENSGGERKKRRGRFLSVLLPFTVGITVGFITLFIITVIV
jgi:hypothetical protein